MKKSKVFLTTGSLVLAVTAIFATKATKKFATVTTAYTNSTGVIFILKDANATLVPMTTARTGNQLKLQVAGLSGTNSDLVTFNGTSIQYK
jgi:hypothetical protein